LDRIPKPRNQVASVSGLSNAYISELERGSFAKVGREKLISLAVALDLNLRETEELLAVFNGSNLTKDDIPIFLETVERGRISSALYPVRSAISQLLLFALVEKIPGHLIILADRPTAILRSEGHRTYIDRHMAEAGSIYADLVEAIFRKRKHYLLQRLEKYPTDQYICREILDDYVRKCDDTEEREWRVRHIENLLWHIRNYNNFTLYLTRISANFAFTLNLTTESEKETDKLLFVAKELQFVREARLGRLTGFATDNKIVIQNFKKEVEFIEETVIEEYLDRRRLEAYLEGLLL
jgi:transcriptional regulator with XRE-family HTH domain